MESDAVRHVSAGCTGCLYGQLAYIYTHWDQSDVHRLRQRHSDPCGLVALIMVCTHDCVWPRLKARACGSVSHEMHAHRGFTDYDEGLTLASLWTRRTPTFRIVHVHAYTRHIDPLASIHMHIIHHPPFTPAIPPSNPVRPPRRTHRRHPNRHTHNCKAGDAANDWPIVAHITYWAYMCNL